MRHCANTSEGMRGRIWALLRQRDRTRLGGGEAQHAAGTSDGVPDLTVDTDTEETKQQAPTAAAVGTDIGSAGGEGTTPPGWAAASDGEPPDEFSLEKAAATAQPREQELTDRRCLVLKEIGRREIIEFLDSYGQYKRGCGNTPVPLSLFVQRDLLSAIAKYEFGLATPEELTEGDLER